MRLARPQLVSSEGAAALSNSLQIQARQRRESGPDLVEGTPISKKNAVTVRGVLEAVSI